MPTETKRISVATATTISGKMSGELIKPSRVERPLNRFCVPTAAKSPMIVEATVAAVATIREFSAAA
jgi:hypothetical protein